MSTMGYVTTLTGADDAATVKFDFANQDYKMSGLSKQFADIVNFSRGSTGGRFNEKGLYETVVIDQPRFDYNPLTKVARGILIEPQRANMAVLNGYPAMTPTRASYVIDGQVWIDGVGQFNKLVEDSSNGTHFAVPTAVTFQQNTTYSFSAFVKAAGRSKVQFLLTNVGSWNNARGEYNLSTGVAQAFNGSTVSMEEIGNGVWRIKMTVTTKSDSGAFTSSAYPVLMDTSTNPNGAQSYQGDGVSGMYIDGLQIEQSSFVTSYIPVPRTFQSRTTTATRVDSKGVIKVAGVNVARAASYDWFDGVLKPIGTLLEPASTNLIRRASEAMNISPWVSAAVNLSPYVVGPDNNLTATNMIEVAGDVTGSRELRQTGHAVTSGTTYTLSVYVKSVKGSAARRIRVGFGSNSIIASGLAQGVVDLSTMTVVTTSTQNAIVKLQKVNDGWARVSVTVTADNSASVPFYFTLMNVNNPTYTGDGVSGVSLYGAQLEVGSAASSYIQPKGTFTSRSTVATYLNSGGSVMTAGVNVSREDTYGYDGDGKLVPRGTLFEAAATNLIRYSSDFTNALWSKVKQGTGVVPVVAANASVAPDATMTACNITFAAPVNGDESNISQQFTTASGAVYTGSMWIKAATSSDVGKTVIYRHAGNTSYKAVTLTADYQYVSLTETANSTTGVFYLGLRPALLGSSGTVAVSVWGVQVETGATPSSYIQTQATATTRAADVYTSNTVTRAADIFTSVSTTRVADYAMMDIPTSGWFNQSLGTFTVTGMHTPTSTGNRHILGIQGPTNADWLAIRSDDSNKVQVGAANTSGSATTTMSGYTVADSVMFNAALKYKLNDAAFDVNGDVVQPDASCTWPSVVPYTKLMIGTYQQANAVLSGWISKITYFDKAIPNTQVKIISA